MHTQSHIAVDTKLLQQQILAKGFATAKDFADAVGVHRNTVGNYLSGRAALPGALARILTALDLSPADVFSLPVRRRQVPGLVLSGLLEELCSAKSEAAFVLFGSRARGTPKPYSDYDLGVFSPEPLEFAGYSSLMDITAAWNDESLATAQLVDLTHADNGFLSSIAHDLVFLAGSHAAWCGLLRKTGVHLYE